MEENEELEEEGNKVTSGEENEDMLHGPEDGGADAELDHVPSESTLGPTDDLPINFDSTKINESSDPEPGVPDQDF